MPAFDTGPGVFGGTHIRYDSTIKPGHLYRTNKPGKLEFGSQISAFCTRDFEFIKVKVGGDENSQDYKDELSGKISASASGIGWIKALFDLSAAGEVAVTADFKGIHSNDAENLAEIQSRLGAKCKQDIRTRRQQGFDVFLVQRTYRTKDTATLTAFWKAGAKGSIGNLKFVKVGPSGEIEGSRRQTRTFRGTVVEIVPYAGE
jgi:hypothetical protein